MLLSDSLSLAAYRYHNIITDRLQKIAYKDCLYDTFYKKEIDYRLKFWKSDLRAIT